jgi:hypothetical protein
LRGRFDGSDPRYLSFELRDCTREIHTRHRHSALRTFDLQSRHFGFPGVSIFKNGSWKTQSVHTESFTNYFGEENEQTGYDKYKIYLFFYKKTLVGRQRRRAAAQVDAEAMILSPEEKEQDGSEACHGSHKPARVGHVGIGVGGGC